MPLCICTEAWGATVANLRLMTKRTVRTLTNGGLWQVVLAVALMASAAPAGAMQAGPGTNLGTTEDAVPGEQQLVNFEHVYNFETYGLTNPTGRGTDLEFYTSAVPKRDYATGELLDAAGNPLPAGEAPVIVTRDFSIMGSYLGGAWVYDITDPESVQFVRNIPCNQTQNDVQIKQFGSRWVLALARDGGTKPCVSKSFNGSSGAGIAVFDVTDPYDFKPMYSFRTTGGAHNFTFHPTKPYGYISPGDIGGAGDGTVPDNVRVYRAVIPIIDFTNVDNPVLATTVQLTEGSPHDISFSADGLRAFVANENHYRIYDTSNPAAPTLISVTPNNGTYAHGYDSTPDRKVAIGTNESLALGGFFVGNTTVCPGEGLTFYSVEGALEQAPVPLGYFEASVQGRGPDDRACTGHVGKVGNKALVTGWYIGGVRVVDFTNPSLPQEVGIAVMEGAEVWAAKFYKGPYVYAADLRRGFDVFRWTGATAPPWQA